MWVANWDRVSPIYIVNIEIGLFSHSISWFQFQFHSGSQTVSTSYFHFKNDKIFFLFCDKMQHSFVQILIDSAVRQIFKSMTKLKNSLTTEEFENMLKILINKWPQNTMKNFCGKFIIWKGEVLNEIYGYHWAFLWQKEALYRKVPLLKVQEQTLWNFWSSNNFLVHCIQRELLSRKWLISYIQ